MEVRCARVVVRLRPEKGSPAGAMAYGPLLIRSVAADTRLGPLVQGQMPTWRGDRSVEVLLPPGAYILSLRDGAKRLTAGGSWRAATVEELEFRVDGVQDQEIEFVLPPPTPSAEIDR